MENFNLTSILWMANKFYSCGYFVIIHILSLMKTLKELDEMRYAYGKKARLQKYKNINSQMAFRNKNYKNASPVSRCQRAARCQRTPPCLQTIEYGLFQP